MKWIEEHRIFSVITGIIVLLFLVILVSYLSAGGTTIVGRGMQKAMTVIEKPFAQVSSGVSDTLTGMVRYRSVKTENEQLKEENAKLERQNADLKLKKDELSELKKLAKSFDFQPYQGTADDAVAANVIELDYSSPYVIFTVDAGKEKGIKKDDVVCNGDGLVGRVQETGKGWSKIASVLSDGNNISFRTLRKGSITGVLKGNGKNKMTGYLLSSKARVVEGDTLITSGVGIYPKGIRIGKVDSVEFNDNTQLKMVTVKPAVTFRSMDKVAIFI